VSQIWDYDFGCINNDFMGYVMISPLEMVEKYIKKKPSRFFLERRGTPGEEVSMLMKSRLP
jgi:hypothetical protein